MAEVKKSIVAKADEKKAEVKAEPVAEVKKEEAKAAPVKKAAAAKKTVAKKAVEKKAEVKAEVKKVAAKAETKVAETAKKVATKKAATTKAAAKETISVQFAGKDYTSDAIMKLAKDAYKATKNKAAIKTINVYVNTDDSRAYYVVNDEFHGSVEL